MDTSDFKGNWDEQKRKMKQKFAALTDYDLFFENKVSSIKR